MDLGQFGLNETYNHGWQCTATLVVSSNEPLTIGNVMGAALHAGIVPGQAATLRLVYVSEDAAVAARVVRSWPSVIVGVEPRQLAEQNNATCMIRLVDPIAYLSERSIWGAYRGVSAAEMFGGAVSLAAGSNGKPTLEPALPDLPRVVVRSRLRAALDFVPYSIAVGQSLRTWLRQFLGLLAIRMEMLGRNDGSILLTLADGKVAGDPIDMTLAAEDEEDQSSGGRVKITGINGRPGRQSRGMVLDDPTQSGFRRIGSGAVGRLFAGVEISLDEVAYRAMASVYGAYTEMLAVHVTTGQPGFRPGRLVSLDQTIRQIDIWQIAQVNHQMRGTNYVNKATLLNGGWPWHPAPPLRQPPITVPGVVDGGRDYVVYEPVPRDRLGRIPIFFPFAPSKTAADAWFAQFDSTEDGRVTPSDFEEVPQLEDFDAEMEALRNGDYDDPYPARPDDELTETELAERNQLKGKRQDILRYLAYQRALAEDSADRDRDGYVTPRDSLVSDDAAAVLRAREGMDEGGDEGDGSAADQPALSEEDQGILFGDDPEGEQARRAAEAAPERWPPRLPLTIIQPMAGGLHGFIPSHRQGDACRVAVHDPFWAEVVGFQYREDRQISSLVSGATAGIVVEHNFEQAWSGVVFRPSKDIESEMESEGGESDGE